MYRKEKRIPTLLAFLLLIIGLVLLGNVYSFFPDFFSLAQIPPVVEEVYFTNVTDNSFTVSWFTRTPTLGKIEVWGENFRSHYLDDQDTDNFPRPRTIHYVSVKNLQANTFYQVKIINGDGYCRKEEYCPTFRQKTGAKLSSSLDLPPLRGLALDQNDKPIEGAIVYLLKEGVSPLSGKSDKLGLWVVPLNNLRKENLTEPPEIADSDLVQIFIKTSPENLAQGVIDIKSIRQNLPLPDMKIGNSYNFLELLSKKDLLSSTLNQKILGAEIIKNPPPRNSFSSLSPSLASPINPDFTLLFPKNEGETTWDQRPRFKGTGRPHSQILITVNSSGPQVGKVIVGKDGTWSWRPSQPLSPGVHYLSLQGYDEKGKLITLKRKFIVLKSGERILGESTPSGSLTATPSPLPSPSPTLVPLSPSPSPSLFPSPSPSPSPTPQKIGAVLPTETPTSPPRSGNLTLSLFFLGGGLSLLFLGVTFFSLL